MADAWVWQLGSLAAAVGLGALVLIPQYMQDSFKKMDEQPWQRKTEPLIQATSGIEDLPPLRTIEGEHDDD